MAIYDVKTIYPADEAIQGNKQTTTKQVELWSDVNTPDVLQLFDSYRKAGYQVKVSFTPPAKDIQDAESSSPFDVAEDLTKQGIDYKATLKLKSKGAYDDMIDLMHLIESEGFDMTVSIQLKINENTSLNIDRSSTWTDEDAVFKVSPKASSKDVKDLKSLYDALNDQGYEVEIKIDPQAPKSDDMDSENDSFAAQLAAYPTNTLVTFKLTQDELS